MFDRDSSGSRIKQMILCIGSSYSGKDGILPVFLRFSFAAKTRQQGDNSNKPEARITAIAEAHIGRRAGKPLRRAMQGGCGKYLRFLQHDSAFVDDGGNAGVGRAQHIAAGLQGAHLRNLQVLPRPDGSAKPGIIADICKQSGLGQLLDDLFSKYIFVADIHRHFLPGETHGFLVKAAPGKI